VKSPPVVGHKKNQLVNKVKKRDSGFETKRKAQPPSKNTEGLDDRDIETKTPYRTLALAEFVDTPTLRSMTPGRPTCSILEPVAAVVLGRKFPRA